MKHKFKYLSLYLFFSASCLAQTITIVPAQKAQTIKGWGVSLSWWANIAGGMPQADIDYMTNLAVNDLKYTIFRYNIGGGQNPLYSDQIRKDGGLMPGFRSPQTNNNGWGTADLSKDARQIKVLDKIASYGIPITTEVFCTSPPYWMTKSKSSSGSIDGSENIDPNFIDDYADYIATVTSRLSNRNPKWNIRSIEPFNEPSSNWWKKNGNQEGCFISSGTQAQILWRLWQSQATYAIRDIGLTAPDCNSISETLNNSIAIKKNNPNEFNGISKISTHSYSGTAAEKVNLGNFAHNNGKELWQSESGPLNWTPADGVSWWQRHYMMASRLIEDVRNLKSTVWCDWQFMSKDEGWGMVQQTNWNENIPYQKPVLLKTKGFFCRKNVTNFIKAGYKIIASTDPNSLAAMAPNELDVVVVVVNNTGAYKSSSISLSNFKSIVSFDTYRTSGGYGSLENCSLKSKSLLGEKGILNGSNLSFKSPPFSVTTFVVKTTGAINSNRMTDDSAVANNTEFFVHPNPFTATTTITVDKALDNALIQIFDLTGNIVKTIPNVSGTNVLIERGSLTNGTYILRIASGDEVVLNKKIIIQ